MPGTDASIFPKRISTPMSNQHDSAIDRTLMAEERTFSAWVRTGLTSIATGLGIVKLLPIEHHSWMVTTLGMVLIFVGATSFAFAFAGYQRGARHWKLARRRAVPLWMFGVLSVLLLCGATLALLVVLD